VIETQRRIIGWIFPEKLVFTGDTYRTARINYARRADMQHGQGFLRKRKWDKPFC
jgi:hypothetical protein